MVFEYANYSKIGEHCLGVFFFYEWRNSYNLTLLFFGKKAQ